jgi:hypothetical protein
VPPLRSLSVSTAVKLGHVRTQRDDLSVRLLVHLCPLRRDAGVHDPHPRTPVMPPHRHLDSGTPSSDRHLLMGRTMPVPNRRTQRLSEVVEVDDHIALLGVPPHIGRLPAARRARHHRQHPVTTTSTGEEPPAAAPRHGCGSPSSRCTTGAQAGSSPASSAHRAGGRRCDPTSDPTDPDPTASCRQPGRTPRTHDPRRPPAHAGVGTGIRSDRCATSTITPLTVRRSARTDLTVNPASAERVSRTVRGVVRFEIRQRADDHEVYLWIEADDKELLRRIILDPHSWTSTPPG